MTPLKVADKMHYINNQHIYYYLPTHDRVFEGSIEIDKNHTNYLL